jgi:hypothetical protein
MYKHTGPMNARVLSRLLEFVKENTWARNLEGATGEFLHRTDIRGVNKVEAVVLSICNSRKEV